MRTHASGRRRARRLTSSSTAPPDGRSIHSIRSRTASSAEPSPRRRAPVTGSASMAIDCGPIPARDFNRTVLMARRRSSIHWTSPGPTQGGRGSIRAGQVIYEMHLGTLHAEGTWAAAAEQLPELARLRHHDRRSDADCGFPGPLRVGLRRGEPVCAARGCTAGRTMLRAFVDRAHVTGSRRDPRCRLQPPRARTATTWGTFRQTTSPTKYKNDWGGALNFEGPAPAREYFVENAGYWIDEYHFDGLRLDATQDIHDASPDHVLRQHRGAGASGGAADAGFT